MTDCKCKFYFQQKEKLEREKRIKEENGKGITEDNKKLASFIEKELKLEK